MSTIVCFFFAFVVTGGTGGMYLSWAMDVEDLCPLNGCGLCPYLEESLCVLGAVTGLYMASGW